MLKAILIQWIVSILILDFTCALKSSRIHMKKKIRNASSNLFKIFDTKVEIFSLHLLDYFMHKICIFNIYMWQLPTLLTNFELFAWDLSSDHWIILMSFLNWTNSNTSKNSRFSKVILCHLIWITKLYFIVFVCEHFKFNFIKKAPREF